MRDLDATRPIPAIQPPPPPRPAVQAHRATSALPSACPAKAPRWTPRACPAPALRRRLLERPLEQRRQHDLRLRPRHPGVVADPLERLLEVRRVTRAHVEHRAGLARD